jgi:hypothetical protein
VLGCGLLLGGVGILVFALSTRFAVFAASAFLIGIAAAPAFTLSETLLQAGAEARQRGRVFSARDFLMRLVFLVGVSAAGWSSRAFGIPGTLVLCAWIQVLGAALAFSRARDVGALAAAPPAPPSLIPPAPLPAHETQLAADPKAGE